MANISTELYNYWTNRAASYSDYNQAEMKDVRRENWRRILEEQIRQYFPGKKPEEIQVLDAGTGPGFFAILLAEMGCSVTAVDSTEAMLREARKNAGELSRDISWVLGDVQELDFHSERFNLVVTRNVTWNLPDPKKAYEEWYRVLGPGGVLLNFDADWYGYLYDADKAAAYEQDRRNAAAQNREDCNIGENFDQMERLAKRVPLSSAARPGWDKETAKKVGFYEICCDENIWERVWSEDEKVSCASTPMFLLAARKQDPKDRVKHYWSERSVSFLAHKRKELHDPISDRWMDEIMPLLPKERTVRILDVGCGTGYFSILLAKEGYQVTGIDLTPEMIEGARVLAEEEKCSCEFMVMDAEDPDFPEEFFDVIVTRNLTWTLPHPDVAYVNWKKLLKKGGVLLNFDADYGHDDGAPSKELPKNHAHQDIPAWMATENEAIMAMLPISYQIRPVWDLGYLMDIGFHDIRVDTGVFKRIYLKVDEFYNPVPIFKLVAFKD